MYPKSISEGVAVSAWLSSSSPGVVLQAREARVRVLRMARRSGRRVLAVGIVISTTFSGKRKQGGPAGAFSFF